MLKILFITPHFNIGGTESQIFNIAIRLDRSKFKPLVISIGEDEGQQSDYYKNSIETRSFRIIDLFKIVLFIKANEIDLVHSFYYGDFMGWDFVVSRLAGIKTFITSRRNMGYWRKPRHIIFDIFRNRFTDIVVANSEAVRKKAIVDEKLNPSKVIVIHNGVDFLKYDNSLDPKECLKVKQKFNINSNNKIIGMIGNIKKIKGYDYFLSAVKIIRKKSYNVKFVIAGKGSNEYLFRKTVAQYNLKNNVLLLGLSQDVKKILSIIDIFMYSSLSEGFPNIILEAMASGRPIVCTDVGGVREILQDGYSGLLVPPRNAQALSDAVFKLLEDEKMVKRIGENAKRIVRHYFNMDDCVRKYEDLYTSIHKKKMIKSDKVYN